MATHQHAYRYMVLIYHHGMGTMGVPNFIYILAPPRIDHPNPWKYAVIKNVLRDVMKTIYLG